jgi:hypothetical protein
VDRRLDFAARPVRNFSFPHSLDLPRPNLRPCSPLIAPITKVFSQR